MFLENTPGKPVWDSLCWPQTSVKTLGKAETWNQTLWIIYALKWTWDNLSNLLPVNFIFINRLNDFITSNSVPLITASLSILFNCNLGGWNLNCDVWLAASESYFVITLCWEISQLVNPFLNSAVGWITLYSTDICGLNLFLSYKTQRISSVLKGTKPKQGNWGDICAVCFQMFQVDLSKQWHLHSACLLPLTSPQLLQMWLNLLRLG